MKSMSIVIVLVVAFVLASCASAASVAPTETIVSTSTFTPVLTATIVPTYAYLPTITLVPSSTPFAISLSISPTLESLHSQANYDNNLIVTIKSESFFVKKYHDPVYEVILNFKNNSEKVITGVDYVLVSYQNKDAKGYADIFLHPIADYLGSTLNKNNIPLGESDIVIDVSIFVNGNYSQCTDGSLQKPLYLLLFSLSMGNTDNPLTVSNSLGQKILEIPCKYP